MSTHFHPGSEDVLRRLFSNTFINHLIKSLAASFPFDIDAIVCAVDDTCLAIAERVRTGHEVRDLDSYAYTAARRRLLKHLKAEARHRHSDLVHVQCACEPREDETEVLEKLRALLPRLSPIAQQIIRLRFYEGLSVDGIAERLQMGRSTAYGKLEESLKLFRIWLM